MAKVKVFVHASIADANQNQGYDISSLDIRTLPAR